jgi:hypothetical protein
MGITYHFSHDVFGMNNKKIVEKKNIGDEQVGWENYGAC